MFNVYFQFCPSLIFVFFGVSPGCIAEPIRKVVIEGMACPTTLLMNQAIQYILVMVSECKMYLGSVQILVMFPIPQYLLEN